MRVLLVGQPNCGKTTLFNRLTGRQEHTGNRAGVTVTCARGRMKGTGAELVDLPGLYSFTGGGADEAAARAAIKSEAPDLILNVVDSTALVRGLTLTIQLLGLGRPVAVLLNMADEHPHRSWGALPAAGGARVAHQRPDGGGTGLSPGGAGIEPYCARRSGGALSPGPRDRPGGDPAGRRSAAGGG